MQYSFCITSAILLRALLCTTLLLKKSELHVFLCSPVLLPAADVLIYILPHINIELLQFSILYIHTYVLKNYFLLLKQIKPLKNFLKTLKENSLRRANEKLLTCSSLFKCIVSFIQ